MEREEGLIEFLRPFSVRPLPDKESCAQEHDLMCDLDPGVDS